MIDSQLKKGEFPLKKKLLSGAIIATIAIAGGCQAGDEGAAPNHRNNVDQTRYGVNENVRTGDGMLDVRNHAFERDADRFQNRGVRNLQGVNNRNIDGENNNYFNRANNRTNDHNVDRVGNDTHYEVSKKAANKISEQVEEIDNVYVITTDNNAYVAAELDTDRNDRNNRGVNTNNQTRLNDELSDEVKQEIAKIVKSVDKNIDNVYVSTNPDFYDLANNYAEDLENGHPVRGFFDQLGNMVERLFPENQTR